MTKTEEMLDWWWLMTIDDDWWWLMTVNDDWWEKLMTLGIGHRWMKGQTDRQTKVVIKLPLRLKIDFIKLLLSFRKEKEQKKISVHYYTFNEFPLHNRDPSILHLCCLKWLWNLKIDTPIQWNCLYFCTVCVYVELFH